VSSPASFEFRNLCSECVALAVLLLCEISVSFFVFYYSLGGILREVLGCGTVHACHDGVITFIRFKGHHIYRAEVLLLQSLNFVLVNDLRGESRVDTGSLDSNDEMSTVLHEHVSVVSQDSSLIGLGDIGEDNVDHRYKHSVFLGVSSVFHDGDDVSTLLGHVHEIASNSLGEFNGVNVTLGSDEVTDVRDSSSGGSSQVEDLASGLHVNVFRSTDDGGSELRAEGVPHSVFSLDSLFFVFSLYTVR